MHFKHWTLDRAYDYVMSIRRYINPNPHYIRQLYIFQQVEVKPSFLRKLHDKLIKAGRNKPLAVVLALNHMDKKKPDPPGTMRDWLDIEIEKKATRK